MHHGIYWLETPFEKTRINLALDHSASAFRIIKNDTHLTFIGEDVIKEITLEKDHTYSFNIGINVSGTYCPPKIPNCPLLSGSKGLAFGM